MMKGLLTLDQLREKVSADEIDTVLACQVDMQGRLMGKRFVAQHFVNEAWEETHSCNYLQATDVAMETVQGYKSTSWEKGYGDYIMKPDLSTLRHIPWLEKTALVLCDLLDHHGHEEVPHSPRAVLKRQIARLEAMGYKAFMASELEFFLFHDSYGEALQKGYRQLQAISPYNEDYHIFQTSKEEEVMQAIRNGLYGAGIPVENSKGEACAGQEEINVKYSDALNMADNHVITKNGCKEIAYLKGKALTFMAKWDTSEAGNSSHVHQSLWNLEGSESLFFDADAEHGMSDLLKHYLAGLLHHARDITYFLAPFINSYKRFAAGTFAPTKAVWSMDNRTAGFRLCAVDTKGIRIECRIGGGDLNPYLAASALIAAGIDGIENKRQLEDEFVGDAYVQEDIREIPKTLREATELLENSDMLRQAFGDEVIDHYVHTAKWEQAEHDRNVTDWEISRGFEQA